MTDQSEERSGTLPSAPTPPPSRSYGGSDEMSILEILVVLARHKRLVLVFPFACAVIAALLSLALPNIYTATSRVLPPQQGFSPIASALIGNITGAGADTSLGQALALKNPSDLYVGILKSRTIADAMIRHFELQKLYKTKTLVDTRGRLTAVSDITAGTDGIITIKVDDKDPNLAAAMANAYVHNLDKLMQNVAVTTAARQRIFLERQLHQVKDQLTDAEVALRNTQERTGIISLTEQGKATIESVASLRALIAAKQVEIAAMGTGMTETNPDYVRARHQLSRLNIELAKLERNSPTDTANVIPPAAKIPEAGLEYLRKARDVRYYQTLFDLIAKQYEIAKSQEAAEGGPIQVLDRAVAPDKKSKPHRALIVIVTGLVAGVFGLLAAFALEARERARRDPTQSKLLDELQRQLPRWRKRRST